MWLIIPNTSTKIAYFMKEILTCDIIRNKDLGLESIITYHWHLHDWYSTCCHFSLSYLMMKMAFKVKVKFQFTYLLGVMSWLVGTLLLNIARKNGPSPNLLIPRFSRITLIFETPKVENAENPKTAGMVDEGHSLERLFGRDLINWRSRSSIYDKIFSVVLVSYV